MSVDRAAELLGAARSAVALTGAGVSAESGIPTFRGEGGLWTKYDPIKVSSIDTFLADPTGYWEVARERGGLALAARPNPGHEALAALESQGRLVAVITQNTDGLHQAAGSTRVIELHGSGRIVECLECGAREPRAEVQARLDAEMPPRCRSCGRGLLKPTVVLFGEPMPLPAVDDALQLVTELVTNSIRHDVPLAAVRAGARLIVINAEPTPFDRLAEVVIHGRSGEVLPQILTLIGG